MAAPSCHDSSVMNLRSALLLLPLVFATLLAAETPPVAPEVLVAPPSENATALAAKPDAELAAVRQLLEAGGLIVSELNRMESGKFCAGIHFGLSNNPRLRAESTLAFVERSRASGIWLVGIGLRASERSGLNGTPWEAREELAKKLHYSPFVRDVLAVPGEEDEEDSERKHTFYATHHASVIDPRSLAAFVTDISMTLSEMLSIEAEGLTLLVTSSERKRESLTVAQKNLADRLRVRAIQGLTAPAPGSPAAEDPLSMASHALSPPQMGQLLIAHYARDILPELESSSLAALAGHHALRFSLRLSEDPYNPAYFNPLVDLAHDSDDNPRNAWALYHLGRHVLNSLGDDDQAPDIIYALDALRQSVRLGCEEALSYYLHVLKECPEDLVGTESHLQQRERWEALWFHFNPHIIQEAVEVEQAYRSGDLSPVLVGVDAVGEELRQVRLAVDEMNVARKARGWKLIQVFEEKPASEPLVEEPPAKVDSAEAGSSREA